jgi:hypothetical protein
MSQLTWSEPKRDSSMNTTLAPLGNQSADRLHESRINQDRTDTPGRKTSTMERGSNTTLSQRVAICFVGGVVGALAVLSFSHVLAWFGLGVKGPIHFPASFEPPGIYRPLFWGGLWGIPFGLFIKAVWNRRYLFGFLYFLVPMAALFLFFLPKGGAGYFGLKASEPMFPLYVTLINVPFGITIALVARAIIGKNP